MCIQDWQIGRLIRCIPRRVIVPTTSGIIMYQDKDRVAITFCNDSNSQVVVMPKIQQGNAFGFVLNGVDGNSDATISSTIAGTLDQSAVVLTSANPVVSANYTGSIGTGAIALTETGTVVGSGVGFPNWLHFTLKDFGDLPMQQWSGVAANANETITIIEYVLPEDVLHMTPDELRAVS